ncbi:MAG: hypothetical protein ACK5PB_22415 [Pirellula sp.]|jgi:hypothetical protein
MIAVRISSQVSSGPYLLIHFWIFASILVGTECLRSTVHGQAFIPARPVQPAPEELATHQQHVRGLIQNELDLIAIVVKPNDTQAQSLVNLAESQWEATSLREVTRRVQQHVHGSIDFDGLVERSVSAWCKEALTEEQIALYQSELEDRQQLRKEALIARMLTWLQNKLSLSASQTDQVERVLRERWKDRWYRSIEATFANETLLPEINQKWLEDILTPAQKNAMVVRSPTEKNTPMPDVFPVLPLSKRFEIGNIASSPSIPVKAAPAAAAPAANKEPMN